MRAVRRNRRKLFCAIDTTAFSIIMVILVFSAYLVVFAAAQKGFSAAHSTVYLPRVTRAQPVWEDLDNEMTVTIARDGQLFFGFHRVIASEIPSKIREQLICGAERKVYLKVDARTQYRNVAKVLGYIRYAGIERVTFLAQQREPQD